MTVKELSKGVQREMNAGIAGVSRMIERLELASKRSNSPIVPVRNEGTSGFRNEASGGVVQNVSSVAPSHISSTDVVSRMEIPPRAQVSPLHLCLSNGFVFTFRSSSLQ